MGGWFYFNNRRLQEDFISSNYQPNISRTDWNMEVHFYIMLSEKMKWSVSKHYLNSVLIHSKAPLRIHFALYSVFCAVNFLIKLYSAVISPFCHKYEINQWFSVRVCWYWGQENAFLYWTVLHNQNCLPHISKCFMSEMGFCDSDDTMTLITQCKQLILTVAKSVSFKWHNHLLLWKIDPYLETK